MATGSLSCLTWRVTVEGRSWKTWTAFNRLERTCTSLKCLPWEALRRASCGLLHPGAAGIAGDTALLDPQPVADHRGRDVVNAIAGKSLAAAPDNEPHHQRRRLGSRASGGPGRARLKDRAMLELRQRDIFSRRGDDNLTRGTIAQRGPRRQRHVGWRHVTGTPSHPIQRIPKLQRPCCLTVLRKRHSGIAPINGRGSGAKLGV